MEATEHYLQGIRLSRKYNLETEKRELLREFSEVKGFKINMQKLLVY